MPDIRLIAMDLDGTLLTTDKRLTERNRHAMEKAAEAGIFIVPATGRIYSGLPEEIKGQEDRVLYRAEIPWETALDVMTWLDGFPVIYDCYQDGQAYMTAEMLKKVDRYAPSPIYLKMILALRKPVPDLKERIRTEESAVQKIQAFCKTVKTQMLVMEKTAERFPQLAVTSSIARNIEINDGQANKGAALQALCEYLGIGTEAAAAFGDGSNDLSMIRAAGIGVAMENGVQEVKDTADRIAPGNDEDGVGRMIEEIIKG